MPALERQQSRPQSSNLASLARPNRADSQSASMGNPLLAQQQALGNKAVQRLLRSGVIQAKLTIKGPGDQYEQEADLAAEQVMRIPEPQALQGNESIPGSSQTSFTRGRSKLQRKCACGGTAGPDGECAECRQKRLSPLQRRATDQAKPTSVPPVVHEVLQSPGRPLDPATRAFMEARFGHDLGRVNIHTDARAAESARQVNALAYTVGQHVVFGARQYATHTEGGQRLLAHELAHTIQQSTAGIALQRQGDPRFGTVPEIEYTIADFCKPIPDPSEAQLVHSLASDVFVPSLTVTFGSEVGELWRSYLSRRPGESLSPRVFSDPSSEIVQGFVGSETTAKRQDELVNEIKSRLSRRCPRLRPNSWTDVPLRSLLPRNILNYRINFNKPFEIPGNIAGGVGESAAGPDFRQVSGDVSFFRAVDATGHTTGVLMRTNFHFLVRDAVDFCPGDPGAGFEQHLTIPLSRLEASGLAHDVPFEVRYNGNPIEISLDPAQVRRCWPARPPRRRRRRPQPILTPVPTTPALPTPTSPTPGSAALVLPNNDNVTLETENLLAESELFEDENNLT